MIIACLTQYNLSGNATEIATREYLAYVFALTGVFMAIQRILGQQWSTDRVFTID